MILGIGNILRGDDGVGAILANRIKDKVPFIVFDAGVSPENYLEKIIKEKPNTILIIDAIDFGGEPGQIKVLNHKKIKEANFYSTHNISINLFINYLLKEGIKNIIILAIQPKEIKLKDQLSKEVNLSLRRLEKEFFTLFKNEKD
jgi:hydrogenase 3 maturation protease